MKLQAKAGSQIFELIVRRVDGNYIVEVDGKRHVVDAQKLEGDFYTILTDARSYEVSVERASDGYLVRRGAATQRVMFHDPSRSAREAREDADGPQPVISVMPGRIVRVLVADGDQVEKGQGVAVVEAMKMENEIAAPKSGTVSQLNAAPGQNIEGGGRLMVVE